MDTLTKKPYRAAEWGQLHSPKKWAGNDTRHPRYNIYLNIGRFCIITPWEQKKRTLGFYISTAEISDRGGSVGYNLEPDHQMPLTPTKCYLKGGKNKQRKTNVWLSETCMITAMITLAVLQHWLSWKVLEDWSSTPICLTL